ncbi:MAG: ABC transporter substrate-binding protein [Actinobacteria bacterium]|nr:ABC transporter substrate-binding protein [Actinomycetota bacterium]
MEPGGWRFGRRLPAGAAVLLAVLMAACGGTAAGNASTSQSSKPITHVNFGLNVPTDFDLVLPQYVARDRGFFTQQGLDVTTSSFQGGADAVKAMVAGSLDLDAATGLDAPAAVAKGASLREFAGGGVSTSTFRLVATNSSGIKALKDLKGKKIGITRFGSLTDYVARVEGQKAGLKAGTDFTEIPIGASAMQAALENGQIDATNANPVDAIPLLAGGKVHSVTDFSKVDPNTQFTALVATPTYLNQHPGTVRSFLKAYFQAIKYLQAHRTYGIQATTKALHVDSGLAAQLYDQLAKAMNTDGSMNLAGVKAYAQALPDLGIAPNVPSLNDYYTNKFIPVKTT